MKEPRSAFALAEGQDGMDDTQEETWKDGIEQFSPWEVLTVLVL